MSDANSDIVVRASLVTKSYKLYDSPRERLKEAILPFGRSYHREFFALRDVSLEMRRGESLGLIGRNGSGKSTFLKILAGVLTPTSGLVDVRGRVSALLELGTGFNPELTGRENIHLSCTIMGYTKWQIAEKEDEIVAFADIGTFIDQPIKTYSSGMQVRLAFAVATSVDPEILIIDEALAVGDMYFQAKSGRRIRELMGRNCSTIVVSHDMSTVKSLCSRAVYFEAGTVKAMGPSGEVCDLYIDDQIGATGAYVSDTTPSTEISSTPSAVSNEQRATFLSRVADGRRGNAKVQILYAELCNRSGHPVAEATHGESLQLRLIYQPTVDTPELVVALYVKDKNQVEVIGTNNVYERMPLRDLKAGQGYELRISFDNYLKAGNYSLLVILADSLSTTQYFDWVEGAVVFRSSDRPRQTRWAVYNPPFHFEHHTV